MSDMKKLNPEELDNIVGGSTKTVQTGTTQNAAVRSGAGKNFPQITSLTNGTKVNFTGYVEFNSADGRNWAEISAPVHGFVAASILGMDR